MSFFIIHMLGPSLCPHPNIEHDIVNLPSAHFYQSNDASVVNYSHHFLIAKKDMIWKSDKNFRRIKKVLILLSVVKYK